VYTFTQISPFTLAFATTPEEGIMSTSIKFNGKEVQNPVARILIVLIAMFGFVMLPIIIGVIALAVVLTIPLHFILRLCGRRGFCVREGNSHTWTSTGAFARR
jgi:hypothetical protein